MKTAINLDTDTLTSIFSRMVDDSATSWNVALGPTGLCPDFWAAVTEEDFAFLDSRCLSSIKKRISTIFYGDSLAIVWIVAASLSFACTVLFKAPAKDHSVLAEALCLGVIGAVAGVLSVGVLLGIVRLVFSLNVPDSLRAKLVPLSDVPYACERICKTLKQSASARQYRDRVVSLPRTLRYVDALIMDALHEQECQRAADEVAKNICLEVHGVTQPLQPDGT